MRNPLRPNTLLAACLLACAASSVWAQGAAPNGAPTLALVIGNSAYTALPPLPACELSANLAAAALSRAGFRVTKALNPSNAQMGSALSALGDAVDAAPGARTVVYYCGYASTFGDRDRAFVLPVDARLERESDLLTQGIVARLLVSSALAAKSTAGLVMMDLASVPNSPGKVEPGALLRPADATHGGVAIALLRVAGSPVTGPLASALSDLVLSPPVELQAALAGLAARPDIAVRPPTSPSMLLGAPAGPPVANLVPPPPSAPSAPPSPSAPSPPPPPPPVAAPPPPAPAIADLNTADRRRIQLSLKNLGLYRGQVTGRFGLDTLAAIRHFQADSNEEQTGRLTTKQVERLVR